jgi:sulfoxide reductase heme-binding subunit YedZ
VPAEVLYILCAIHIGWLFWLAASGQMGAEPIKALEHAYGLTALKLILAVLAITPLLKRTRLNLVRFRRALGVSAFVYVLAHLMVWLALDVQVPGLIWAEIVKRPYITVGMAGFALLLPLAVTSNDWAVRRMGGAAWRSLHRLAYPAAVLGAVHFVMLRKGFQIEPLVYLLLIVALLLLRVKWAGLFARTAPSS